MERTSCTKTSDESVRAAEQAIAGTVRRYGADAAEQAQTVVTATV